MSLQNVGLASWPTGGAAAAEDHDVVLVAVTAAGRSTNFLSVAPNY